MIVAQTCLKLDPFNPQVEGLVNQLTDFKKGSAARAQFNEELQKLQTEAAANPTNFHNILALGGLYAQMQDTNRATELFKQSVGLFDAAMANPNLQADSVRDMAEIAAMTGNLSKLEVVLEKLAQLKPDEPEAHYDLAALKAITGKIPEAMQQLQLTLDLSAKRLATNPAARNMLNEARNDPRFNGLHNLPEFQKLVPGN